MATNEEPISAPKYPRPDLLNSVKGIFDLWWNNKSKWVESVIPAMFLGYKDNDRASGMVWVQPLVNKMTSDKQTQVRGRVLLPVRHFQHGTFMIDAPLVEGDTGWIVAGDRDNTNVLAANGSVQEADSGIGKHDDEGNPLGNQGPQPPGLLNSHRYIYGFFLPDKWGGIPLPPEMKDSLVIGQVSPVRKGEKAAPSHGRFVLDPDGTIHVLSTKWYDAKEQKLRGGAVLVDLSWKGKESADELQESWHLGEHQVKALETILGDLTVAEWEDPDGSRHGGNLTVEHDAEVKGGFVARLKSAFYSVLDVFGEAFFHSKVTVKNDTSRTVTIDPKSHLAQSDAKFREVYIVTGQDINRSHDGKVALKLERRRILSDERIEEQPVVFDVGSGGGGGGDVLVDDKSIDKVLPGNGNPESILEIKGWKEQENESDSLKDALSGKSRLTEQYAVLVRSEKDGSLFYLPIGTDDSSEESSESESSESESSESESSDSEGPEGSEGSEGSDSGDSGSGDDSEDESDSVVTKVVWNTSENKHQLEYYTGTINLKTGKVTESEEPVLIVAADPCDCPSGGGTVSAVRKLETPNRPAIPDFSFISEIRLDPSSPQPKLQMKKGYYTSGLLSYDQDWSTAPSTNQKDKSR